MAQADTHQLNPGDDFPKVQGISVKHGRVALPDDLPENHYGVILAYRAHW